MPQTGFVPVQVAEPWAGTAHAVHEAPQALTLVFAMQALPHRL